ncbi:uncharacterized protein [Atheta coriaria]|uniref:uncharacterized protein n=1 Tax=Dalotia coriaria TaxID=877792 RepID=UPI0031F37191
MISKNPKSNFLKTVRRAAVIGFVLEAVSFAVCYAGYHRLNTERDFRLYIRDNYPSILDLYYKVGETLGDSNLRQQDNNIWFATQSRK